MSGHTEHTPTPWTHAGRAGGWDGVNAADGTPICDLDYNNPANATFIALACNAYADDQRIIAELRAALQEAKGLLVKEGYLPFSLKNIDAALKAGATS